MFTSPGARPKSGGGFSKGTTLLFYQASAPLGWTKLLTQNDKALRVVSGSGGVSGGTNAFSTVMAQSVVGSTTLSTAQIASHQHTERFNDSGFAGSATTASSPPTRMEVNIGATQYLTVAQGGGGSHNHSITMDLQYIDLILASKN
jgi:hypothetical protein